MRYVFIQKFEVKDLSNLQGTLKIDPEWSVFQDHFPGFPIFPGALILETMAQHTVVLMMQTKPSQASVIPTLVQVDRAKFIEPVYPPAELEIKIQKEAEIYPNFKFLATASIAGREVANARLTMAFKAMPISGGLDFMAFFAKGGV